jgi:small basic protein (TIGR04137 family)
MREAKNRASLEEQDFYTSVPSSKGRNHFMSQHRSLKGTSTIAAKRNVLKRFERVDLLKKRGQFQAGDKVIGLRKTKPEE